MGLFRFVRESWLSATRRAAQAVLAPVLDRALHADSKNIARFRQRQALAETAAFVDAHLAAVRSFPDASKLMAHAMSLVQGKAGLLLEFGVATGRSINRIAALAPGERVYGFDSFEGLPEDWEGVMPEGTFKRRDLPQVRENVELVRGLFSDTLGPFLDEHPGPVKLLHVDCDLYTSTKVIFDHTRGRIEPGTVIVFDEFFNYAGWQQHEYKAFGELLETTGRRFEYVGYCRYGSQVAVRMGETE